MGVFTPISSFLECHMRALVDRCARCGAPTRFFHTSIEQVMLLCSEQEVRHPPHPCAAPQLSRHSEPHACCLPSSPQCPWPLDEADDLEEFCLPATDERVVRHSAEPLLPEPSCAPPPPRRMASATRPSVHAAASSELDELQRIGNMLLQSSPACSPTSHPSMPPMHRLPSVDSLPSSTLLAPAHADHEAAMMAAFALPPAFSEEAESIVHPVPPPT